MNRDEFERLLERIPGGYWWWLFAGAVVQGTFWATARIVQGTCDNWNATNGGGPCTSHHADVTLRYVGVYLAVAWIFLPVLNLLVLAVRRHHPHLPRRRPRKLLSPDELARVEKDVGLDP